MYNYEAEIFNYKSLLLSVCMRVDEKQLLIFFFCVLCNSEWV